MQTAVRHEEFVETRETIVPPTASHEAPFRRHIILCGTRALALVGAALSAIILYSPFTFSALFALPSARIPTAAQYVICTGLLVACLAQRAVSRTSKLRASCRFPSFYKALIAVTGLVAYAILFRYFPWDQRIAAVVWALCIVATGAFVARKACTEWSPLLASRGVKRDLIFLTLLAIAGGAYAASTLGSAKYFMVGDEDAFFGAAREIAAGRKTDVLWGLGGHNEHPAFASLYTALFLKVLSEDIFSFRLASVVAWSSCVFPLYIGVRAWCGRGAGLFAALSFISTFYVQQFGHCGYNNSLALPILSLVWCFCSLTLKKRAYGMMWFAGASAALGLYCNYFAASYAGLPLCVPVLLYLSKEIDWRMGLRQLALCITGYLVVGLPILLHSDVHVRKAFVEHARSVVAKTDSEFRSFSLLGASEKLFSWAPQKSRVVAEALLSPVGFRGDSHYSSGKLFDGVTGVLYVIGLFGAIFCVIRREWKELWMLAGIGGISLGLAMTDQYDRLVMTRLIVMVPLVTIVAARGFALLFGASRERPLVALGACAGIVAAALNLQEVTNFERSSTLISNVWQGVNREVLEGRSVLVVSPGNLSGGMSLFQSLYSWNGTASSMMLQESGAPARVVKVVEKMRPASVIVDPRLSTTVTDLSAAGYTKVSPVAGWTHFLAP